jgi:hypothetical protein
MRVLTWCCCVLLVLMGARADGHAEWTKVLTIPDGYCPSLVTKGGSIFAGSFGCVYRSTDGGVHWTVLDAGLPSGIEVTSMTVTSMGITAGTGGAGIFQSVDDGESWVETNTGLTTPWISALLSKEPFVFSATSNGIFRSSNNGTTWSPVGGTDWDALCLGADDVSIYAVSSTFSSPGVFRSTNNGSSWTNHCDQFAEPYRASIALIGKTVIVGTRSNGIWRSSDLGDNWTNIYGHASVLFPVGQYLLGSGEGSGVWISPDGGVTGVDVSGGFNEAGLAITVQGGDVFVATVEGGIWKRSLHEILKELAKNQWVGAYYFAFNQDPGSGFLKPDQIDMNTITHVYHFWITPEDSGTIDAKDVTPARALELTTAVRRAGGKALISIGGDTSGIHFLNALNMDSKGFVDALVSFMMNGGYDGIDIDWEGNGDASISDIKNRAIVKSFIYSLRSRIDEVDTRLLLTAAARGGDEELYAELIDAFDQINLMTYDIGGEWLPRTWHNAPLYSYWVLGIGNVPRLSVREIVDGYVKAGIPRSKLSLGIPFYGKLFGGGSAPGRVWDGIEPAALRYSAIRAIPSYSQAYRWDEAAAAPFLGIEDTQNPLYSQFISFDDENSVAKKVQYSMAEGLGGVFAFELGQGERLVDAIEAAKQGGSRPEGFSTLWVYQPSFLDFAAGGTAAVYVNINLKSCEGSGCLSVNWYPEQAKNVRFAQTQVEKLGVFVSPYRWVVTQTGLSSIAADIYFDISKLREGMPHPETVTVYKRPAEGIGAFTAAPTVYDAPSQKLIASVGGFSEFVFVSSNNTFTDVQESEDRIETFALNQNYPNPFNPSTNIEFALPSATIVSLRVFNLLGQEVALLASGNMAAGKHVVAFTAKNLCSGVYFCTLTAGQFVSTRKMMVIK